MGRQPFTLKSVCQSACIARVNVPGGHFFLAKKFEFSVIHKQSIDNFAIFFEIFVFACVSDCKYSHWVDNVSLLRKLRQQKLL